MGKARCQPLYRNALLTTAGHRGRRREQHAEGRSNDNRFAGSSQRSGAVAPDPAQPSRALPPAGATHRGGNCNHREGAKTRRPQPGVTRMPASRVVQKPTLITLGPNRTPRDIATVRRCSPFFILEAHRHSLRAGSRSAMLAPRLGRVLQQHDTDVAETADAEGRRNRNSNNKSTALPPRREDAGRSDSSVASSRLRGLRGKAVPQL